MPDSSVPRHPIDRVAIVMPARNECADVAAAISALADAAAVVGERCTVRLCVVDDGSTDGTDRVARQAIARSSIDGTVVRTDAGSAALARRAGVAAATAGWASPQRAWVLSTDADSRVRKDWIVRHLRHAERGATAVAGVVDLFDDVVSADFRTRWRDDYGSTLLADGRHPHAHATNLGVRLDVYRRIGGFQPGHGAEDTDLWRRLRLGGFDPVADSSIVVDTSGRRTGRVAEGFAHALACLYPPEDLALIAGS